MAAGRHRDVNAERTQALLAWYDRHRRRGLPWRRDGGAAPDPYRVWVSEVMLQQTTVATVIPYYEAFMARWPTVEALAAARLDEVLHAWQGLGYYARARNLHAAAKVVAEQYGGRLPETVAGLAALPGIGAYTAAAVAAIAFGVAATPVDGNVARVLARLHRIETPLPAVRAAIAAHAAALAPAVRAGDFAEALMDLGATLCTPRRPRCPECPWRDGCAGHAGGRPEALPLPAVKPPRPDRFGAAFWIEAADGRVLFRRRPPAGLLGGMMEVPTTPWRAAPWATAEAAAAAPLPLAWQPLAEPVVHVFTHFRLHLAVFHGRTGGAGRGAAADGEAWVAAGEIGRLALPTLFRKVARRVLAAAPAPGG